MKSQQQGLFDRYAPVIIYLICFVVISTSITVLIGWIFKISYLTSIIPGWNAMKVNTAICFILIGIAFLLLQQKNIHAITSPTSCILASVVVLISGLTLCEYIFGINLGIDNVLFSNHPFFRYSIRNTAHPERMVILTAINLFLTATSIILVNVKKSNPWIFQTLAWLIFMLALFSICNYIFGLGSKIYPITLITTMSFYSSILFILLSMAVFLSRINSGMAQILLTNEPIGYLMRMMLFFLLIVPILVNLLEGFGHRKGLYDDNFGDSLNVTASITVFTIIFGLLAHLFRNEQTVRIKAESKLQDTELLFKEFSDNVDVVLYKSSVGSNQIFYVSPAFEKIWGYPIDDLYKNPRLWFDKIIPEDKEKVAESFFNKLLQVPSIEIEYRIRHADGSIRNIYDKIFQEKNTNNQLIALIGIAIDITETSQLKKYNNAEMNINDILQSKNKVEEIASGILRSICRIFEWEIGEIWMKDEEKDLLQLTGNFYKNSDKIPVQMVTTFKYGKGLPGSVWRNIQPIWVSNFADSSYQSNEPEKMGLMTVLGIPIIYQDNLYGVIVLYKKDSEKLNIDFINFMQKICHQLGELLQIRSSEIQLINVAKYDLLTGLIKVNIFENNLNTAILNKPNHLIALTIIDINKFNLINDSFGHSKGDILLRETGSRIRNTLADDGNHVARLAADKFILFIEDIKSIEQIPHQAHLIQLAFNEPFSLDNEKIILTSSMGIAIYPKDGKDTKTLISNANQALYVAKQQGENSIQFYKHEMDTNASKKIKLQKDLVDALSKKQFVPYFQPQIDLKNGEICSAEALIRWQHAEKGILLPKDFIPYAEETGLIIQINEYMLRCIFSIIKNYNPGIPISVNLSAIQFKNGFHLVEYLEQLISEFDVNPNNIELEITESILMQDIKHNIAIFSALKKLGFYFSIDDFGTGFSSFGYLPRIPVTHVKIDRSFIMGLPQKNDDVVIVRSIINLVHSLNMIVIAEGVETKEQLEFLKQEKCDIVQGFYYYKPVPLNEFMDLLKSKK